MLFKFYFSSKAVIPANGFDSMSDLENISPIIISDSGRPTPDTTVVSKYIKFCPELLLNYDEFLQHVKGKLCYGALNCTDL